LLKNEFVELAIIGMPIRHPWSQDIRDAILHPLDTEHVRLASAFAPLNLRAGYAWVLSSVEWTVWRFSGGVDVSDLLCRIEAGWASLIHPFYGLDVQPVPVHEDQPLEVGGPLRAAAHLLQRGFDSYCSGQAVVKHHAFCAALLAEHVCPVPAAYEEWLSSRLRWSAKHHLEDGTPPQHQAAVPRSVMGSHPPVGAAQAKQAAADFLAGLDPATNPYLRAPEAMLAMGFKGTPYVLT